MNRWGWAHGNVCSQFREVVASKVSFCIGENYLDSGILQENSAFYSFCINIHNNAFCVCLEVQLEKSGLNAFFFTFLVRVLACLFSAEEKNCFLVFNCTEGVEQPY